MIFLMDYESIANVDTCNDAYFQNSNGNGQNTIACLLVSLERRWIKKNYFDFFKALFWLVVVWISCFVIE